MGKHDISSSELNNLYITTIDQVEVTFKLT